MLEQIIPHSGIQIQKNNKVVHIDIPNMEGDGYDLLTYDIIKASVVQFTLGFPELESARAF